MTGLPCSGKTTLVKRLQKDIPNLAMLDGDQLREWLSPKDFSKEARNEHNKKVAHLAKLLQNHGVSSAVSLISPYAENRKNAREIIGGETFSEVHVYAKARAGEIKGFTGIDDPYEAPENPDLRVNTESDGLDESLRTILNYYNQRMYRNIKFLF